MFTKNEYVIRMRRQHVNHPHLPQYHFVPPANLLNDPNGLIQWGDTYHLFYQYNPNGAFHGTKHWGHAISDDLVSWHDLPIALTPTPHSPDSSGCWSGSAINWKGVPTLVYTGTQGIRDEIQTQCIATSDDDLISWKKYVDNPIIDAVPEMTAQKRNFRDPYVFEDGDGWSLLLGSQILGQGGTLLLYHSTDFINWEFKHPLMTGLEAETGSPWECPSFFPLGDRHVLIFSSLMPHKRLYYHVGTYENFHFTSELSGTLDHGIMYAPQVFADNAGRQLMFGWIQEERPSEIQKTIGWSGAISLPRELQLDAKGQLLQQIPPEVNKLRGKHTHFDYASTPLAKGQTVLPVTGRMLEITAGLRPVSEGQLTLRVLRHPEEFEYTDLTFDFSKRRFIVERTHASTDPDLVHDSRTVPLESIEAETWTLRVFIDQSVLEIIINEQISLTTRIYPASTNSHEVSIINQCEENPLHTLDVWQMSSIWTYVTNPE